MKTLIFKNNLPSEISETQLRREVQDALSEQIELTYIPQITWYGENVLEDLAQRAVTCSNVPDEISEGQIQSIIENHVPAD